MMHYKYFLVSSLIPPQCDSLNTYRFYEPRETDNVLMPLLVMSVLRSSRDFNFLIYLENAIDSKEMSVI